LVLLQHRRGRGRHLGRIRFFEEAAARETSMLSSALSAFGAFGLFAMGAGGGGVGETVAAERPPLDTAPHVAYGSWGLVIWAIILVYAAIVAVLALYGMHRGKLVATCLRRRKQLREIERTIDLAEDDLPHVTVQLPLFNESTVAQRLVEQTAKLDYPRNRLEIQVLDDSTDETTTIARLACDRMRERGIDVVYLHRTDRTGYKAGALAEGLEVCKGDLVAVFDADFLPQPGFLRSVVGHFRDPNVGCVQARWGHMNREQSMLTRVQALMLDGHHLVDNRARWANQHLFNFSGTGGIWRKRAIHDAGGWEHDTLTEDLDLSYRAQMKGWRFVYRPDVVTPSELPEEMSAFRAQQFRWAKGTVQSARKLLKPIWSCPTLTLGQKIEATYHLTPHFTSPLMLVLSVLLLPLLAILPGTDVRSMFIVDLPLAFCTTGSLAAFYMHAEAAQGRSPLSAIRRLPALMALGTGMAPWVTKAVYEGLRSMAGEFVRTPKKGAHALTRYQALIKLPLAEVILCFVSIGSTIAAIENGHWFAAPFAALFAFGYGYVATLLTAEQLERRRAARTSLVPTT
jgi:cellulose synthase/poly-beta-1,6-N-acetylglucosamine synthase-like glycosyltransferase